jgi:hypothetical protein
VDEKCAFGYWNLEAEINMTLPEGHRVKGKAARLGKAMYGLKQSGQLWYGQLTQPFVSYGFVTSNFDRCDIIHKVRACFITIYADDITLWGHGDLMMKNVKNTLKSKFEVTDLGDLPWILAIQIKFGPKSIELSQTVYIESIR